MSNRELQILKQRGFTLFLGLREMQPPEFLKKKKKAPEFHKQTLYQHLEL